MIFFFLTLVCNNYCATLCLVHAYPSIIRLIKFNLVMPMMPLVIQKINVIVLVMVHRHNTIILCTCSNSPDIDHSPYVRMEPLFCVLTGLVLADENGVWHWEEPHQSAVLQVLQHLMLALDLTVNNLFGGGGGVLDQCCTELQCIIIH